MLVRGVLHPFLRRFAMKRVLGTIVLFAFLLTPSAFASIYTENPQTAEVQFAASVDETRNQAYRSSFFIQGNAGLAVQTYEYDKVVEGWSYSSEVYREKYNFTYSGAGLLLDLKLGVNIKSLFAVYGVLGLTETSGEWDVDGRDHSYSSDDAFFFYRIQFGFGVTGFPFRSFDNILHTFYMGWNFMYCLLEQPSEDDLIYSDHIDKLAFTHRFVLGQVWPLGSSRWNIGYEIYADIDLVLDSDDEASINNAVGNKDDADDMPSSWTIGVAFTIMRK